MKTYSIGRGKSADIVLDDGSVSRLHAELVASDNGKYYLTDCSSANGTFVIKDGKKRKLRQAYVTAKQKLVIGTVKTSVDALLSRIEDSAGEGSIRPKKSIVSGTVERDMAGNIIKKY